MTDRWRIASHRNDLGRKPLVVWVVDRPVILFQANDRIAALEDRCGHRGVPLSLGDCHKGTMVCRYHGWRWDADGACVEVPSSVDGAPCLARVPAYEVGHAGQWIWVRPAGSGDAQPPPNLDPGLKAWRRRFMEPRPADVVRADLAFGTPDARWVAPDRVEADRHTGKVIVVLVPEGPDRTRLEAMGPGRPGSGWPLFRATDQDSAFRAGFEAWLAARPADADWRLGGGSE